MSGIMTFKTEQVCSELSWHSRLVGNFPGLSYFPLKNPHEYNKSQKTTQMKNNPMKQKLSFVKATQKFEKLNDRMRNLYWKMPVLILNTLSL